MGLQQSSEKALDDDAFWRRQTAVFNKFDALVDNCEAEVKHLTEAMNSQSGVDEAVAALKRCQQRRETRLAVVRGACHDEYFRYEAVAADGRGDARVLDAIEALHRCAVAALR